MGDLNYEESLKLAEEEKEAGNKLLLENKLTEALNRFTDAINYNIETKRNAIYYSNRAVCHLKMENTALAIQGKNYLRLIQMPIKQLRLTRIISKPITDALREIFYSPTMMKHLRIWIFSR